MPETISCNYARISHRPSNQMPESRQHQKLVQILTDYVRYTYFGGQSAYILTDSAISLGRGRPPLIGGRRPDLFARQPRASTVILGEAKSIRDFENAHTRDQLSAFLCYCNRFPGSILVIAVPWVIQYSAEALIRTLKVCLDIQFVKTLVLEQLPV